MKPLIAALLFGFSLSVSALPVVKVEVTPQAEACPTVMNSFVYWIRGFFANPSMMN